jgi:NTP pyrophosphatase (non-canonical NTP hydrolase)
MFDFKQLQNEVGQWANKNFGDRLRKIGELGDSEPRPAWHPLLGVSEETGELSHAYLKMKQKIRGNNEKHIEEAKDAVGDILIYLADFCGLMEFDMQEIIEGTWNKVKQRDWSANSDHGNDLDRGE